jgi:hypothetical protein
MAHIASFNPTVTGGRRSRYLTGGVVAYRKLNADETAERHLTSLREYLRGKSEEDTPSVSSVLRRALAVYASHVQAIARDPVGLTYEKTRVREGSRLPTLRKRVPKTRPKISLI